MSSVGCPRCAETFRIPDASLPDGVQVRCPWCTEIFRIGEIAPHLPPMAELLDADHQPISLSAVTLALELAKVTAGATSLSSFGRVPSSRAFNDSNKAYARSNVGDTTTQQPIVLQDANEQSGTRLKWSERLGWTPDPSASRPVAAMSEPASDAIDSDLLSFDSDDDDLNQGREAADPSIALEEAITTTGESRSSAPYEGFEQYDNEPFELEDSDAADGSEYVSSNPGGVAITGPVAPRPLSSSSGEAKVSPSLNAKPRSKKKNSPVKQMIGVVMGGVVALPLAYGILWAMGKAPNVDSIPFIGEAQKELVGEPRPTSEIRSPDRNTFEARPSLAADMPDRTLDPGQDASASDNGASDSMPEAASKDESSSSDPANSVEGDVAADTAEVTVKNEVELPNIPEPEVAKPEPRKPAPTTAPASPQYLAAFKAAQDALTGFDQAKTQNAAGDLRAFKATLYRAITALAASPQELNQADTNSLVEMLSAKGLLSEMAAVGPGWLNSPNRTNAGLLVSGDARELPAGWTMACQGTKGNFDIKLEGVPDGMLQDGDNVVVLGKIEDATAPAKVKCVYIKVQEPKSASKP